jgi:hypothetical protein
MYKKLTITVPESLYIGLYKKVGKGKISKFIAELVRPYVEKNKLDKAYCEMAQDEEREKKALEWSEGLITDFEHETW